jgi:nicotinamidase-related amidase
VESTARQAHEFGYELVLVENAMTSVSPEMHSFASESIFPRIGRIVQAADIVLEK